MKKLLTVLAACSALATGSASAAPREEGKPIRTPTEAKEAQGQQDASKVELAFDQAWESVALGARKTAKAGEWLIERTEEGAVVAYRGAEKGAKAAAQQVDDAAILAAIKARLVADPATSALKVSVDVDKGEVTLKGDVRSAEEAKTAVRLARQTSGVKRVVSHLRWPGMTAPR
ncbi:MAG TPA: BON domain-containing protein [Propionicimonas sp.]|jgi:osmotically-inducible protein OsmY